MAGSFLSQATSPRCKTANRVRTLPRPAHLVSLAEAVGVLVVIVRAHLIAIVALAVPDELGHLIALGVLDERDADRRAKPAPGGQEVFGRKADAGKDGREVLALGRR